MRGANRCRIHLGKSSTAHLAAFEVQQEARRIAGLTAAEPVSVDDVLSEHLALAGETLAWKNVVRGLVEQLTEVGYASPSGEQTKAAVRLYGEALDRCDKVLTNISRLDIDSRMATIQEGQDQRLLAVLRLALAALGQRVDDRLVVVAVQQAIAATEPKRLPGVR